MLTGIQLKAKALSGCIPDTIGKMIKLELLDLSENSVYGSIPESLATCANLTKLVLFSNQLTGWDAVIG
jgi:Leucine-rich repeat (LRR) protein